MTEKYTEQSEVKESYEIAIKLLDKSKLEETKAVVNAYFGSGITIFDFNEIPLQFRLSMVQKTPAMFVKSRKVGSSQIPYIDHFYAEKCLNFISNFNWGSEMIESQLIETMKQTTKGEKKAYESIVKLKMWLYLGDKKIERFIVAGHTMYENPATTRADCIKSAVSKANTVFARQFGVGANIIDAEGRAYDTIVKTYKEVDEIKKENDEAEEKLFSNEKPDEKRN